MQITIDKPVLEEQDGKVTLTTTIHYEKEKSFILRV